MKRIFCFLFIILTVFIVSCGKPVTPFETITSSNLAQTNVYEKNNYSHYSNKSVNTKSKILILDSVVGVSTLYYYSKADGEFYPFCFDPFCDHENFDGQLYKKKCIGSMISDNMRADGNANRVFYINSRIYFVFFDKIYSCSEFATDLRVEVSFSDKMDYYDKLIEFIKSVKLGENSVFNETSFYNPIQTFSNDGKYLLFIRVDEDGNINQYVYDTMSKKLIDLKKKIIDKEKEMGTKLYTYSFENGNVYMAAYSNVRKSNVSGDFYEYVDGDFEGYYVADYDFNGFSETVFVPSIFYDFKTEYGNIELQFKNEEKTVVDLVNIRYDGINERIFENIVFKKEPLSLYLTKDSFYFKYNDPIDLGINYSYNRGKTPQPNFCGGKIYRLDLATGMIHVALDDLSYDSFNVLYLDETEMYGIMTLQKYTINDGIVNSKGGLLYQFKIDKSGKFVNFESVVLG